MVPFYFTILSSWVLFITTLAATAGAIGQRAPRVYDKRFMGVKITALLIVLLYFRGNIFGSSARYYTFVHNHLLVAALGTGLCVLGVALAIWARLRFTADLKNTKDFAFVLSGPYKYVRYPVYSGVLIAMAGSALVGAIPWILIFAATASYIVYRTALEERVYLEAFPNAYPNYQKQTKMLLPFVV
jgi:protein-S-isoprenylcysteine O-methyltransferase Ste14